MAEMALTERQVAISVMCSVFRNFTADQVRAYDRFLSDLPAPLVSAAIGSLIVSMKFPPTVAEIRDEARKIAAKAKGIEAPDAGKSWERVRFGMRRFGSYQFDKFLGWLKDQGDKLTAETIQQFGWEAFANVPDDGMNTARAQYMRMYEANAKRKQEEARISKLAASPRIQTLIGDLSERKALEGGRHETH